MADTLQLDVITPERRLFSDEVDAVSVPGANGELGILPGHTPLISQLGSGVLAYTQGATVRRMHVSGGFVEVSAGRVSVLADVAETPEEIDAPEARRARDEAERQLGTFSGEQGEMDALRTQLERANARLQLTSDNTR
jgi:F-type H+-transporting ATPase subunit epsilon